MAKYIEQSSTASRGVGYQLAVACASALLFAACASTPPPQQTAPAPAPAASVPLPPLATPPPVIKETAPLRYIVKKGDTLWDIASYFLRDPWLWPEVWYVNPQVENPHLIYPGDELLLVYADGRPQVTRVGGGIERLSPRVRATPLDAAIPAIPIDAIRNFLNGPRLVDRDTLRSAPYIVDFVGEHLIGGRGYPVFVKGMDPNGLTSYQAVREGSDYRDPDDGSVIGVEAVPVGQAEVSQFGKPSIVKMLTSVREVRIGDRMLPLEAEVFDANFYPHAPDAEIDGSIISVYDGVSQIGQYNIVAMNRGAVHGLEPGHVLSVFQAGRQVDDPYGGTFESVQLPDINAGTLLVFKTYDRLSYGLIMEAVRPVHILDKVTNPTPNLTAQTLEAEDDAPAAERSFVPGPRR
ncbi:LysM peptidoglycan-binding domain-containing protein [bacterium]|nr:LysM peptidoglycan-binding domain-containing protein [bacterium]